MKVDWCGGDKEKLDPAIQYAEIARAIARAESITGRRLYFSICNWGNNSPGRGRPALAAARQTFGARGGDIVAPIVANTKNADRKAELKEVFREFDQAVHPEAQHSGFYKRSGHDGGRHARPDRGAESRAHEPVGRARRSAAGGR